MTLTGPSRNWDSLAVEIRGMIAEAAEVPITAITDDVEFIADLHLNSLSTLTMFVEIAERYGFRFEFSDFVAATTVGSFLSRLRKILEHGFGEV